MARGVNTLTIPTQYYKYLEDVPTKTLAEIFQSMVTVMEEANSW